MTDIIRDVIIKIAIKQDEVRLKAPDLGPVLLPIRELEEKVSTGIPDAFNEFEKVAVESVKEISDEVQELTKGIDGIKPALEQTSKASEESRQKLTDDTLKMGEGFRTAGEGAFTLARGIAFVGVSSEENLQKAFQTIAQIQGGFDILKGGIDVVKGITEGTRALRLVTAQAAVAETGLASANTAVAVTGAAATVSMRALLLTLGPIAIAATAVGAAFFFFRDAPDDIEGTTAALEKQRRELQAIADLNLQSVNVQLDFGEFSAENRILLLKEKLRIESEKITAESVRTARALQTEALARGEVLSAAEFAVLIAKNDAAILVKKLETEVKIIAVKKAQQAEVKSAFDLTQKAFDLSQKDLQLSKDKIALEKGALQTKEERFAELSDIDQRVLRGAARAKEEGRDLSRRGAELLKSTLGQGVELSKILAERFSASGGEDVFKTFGAGAGVRQAEQEFQEQQAAGLSLPGQAEGLNQTLAEALETTSETFKVSTENIEKFVQQFVELKNFVLNQQAQIDKLNN